MASAHHDHIEVDAAKILHKLIQESKDEPAKLAMKLYVILQHMKLSGKEQSLPYQVISRAMETVISQHGLDMDVLKPSRIPLASGGQIGDTGLIRSKDKDASDSSAPVGGMEMLLRGGLTSASHAASTSMMKDDDQCNSVEHEMIKQEPSAIPNRAPGGSGRVESTGQVVRQGPSSQNNAKSFEHESPASLGMEESIAAISRERLDTTKLDKQVGQGENKKTISKRKKADSAVAVDVRIGNSQQFDSSSNAINMKRAKMVTRGDIQGNSNGKVNDVSSGALSSYPKDQLASSGAEAPTPVTAREDVDHGEGILHSTANHPKGNETLGSMSKESTLGKNSSMEITVQRNAKPTDVDRTSGSRAPASLSMPFKEHHLKQLRAQCLVFLAFRNNLPPRKLHLEIALGESYPKEGSNADEIPTGDVASKEPFNGHEISHLSTNPTPSRGSEKEMLPSRAPPFSSSTGSPVETGASSKGSEVTKKKNKKGPPSDQLPLSEENKHLFAARIKQEADMRIPESADSQCVTAKQLESSPLAISGKNDAEQGSGQLNQAVSSVLRTSRQLEPQNISPMVSCVLNDASKATQTSTSVDGRHLQEKIDSPFHQLQTLKHGDRVSTFHKGKDVEYDYLRHIVKPPGDISMYSRPLGHMEKVSSLLPGMSNNAMDDQGLSSANYTTTEKWIMHQQKRKLLEEQKWSLKQRRTNERIVTRFDKLKENVSSCEDISVRTRSVIELKKLQLLQVQRRLRSDFLHDFFKPIASDMERLKSFKKHRHGRRMKQLERLEQKMKEERQKRVRERQKEFFSEIESHKEKMEDFFKVKRERWKGFNRYVKEFHKRKEKTQREKADRIQREKINLLKINDVEGYLRMVQDAKSDRVKQLLKVTEKYLQKLGSKLQEAKAMARQFEMEMDDNRAVGYLEKNEITVDNEDDADQAQHYLESNEKYYLMAHSIKESISEQPASLEGGKLREYQMNGLRWLVSLYNNNLNGILADEMGLGKTVQVISLMCYLMESKNDRGPFLVVVPSSVLPGWESEINFWAPSLAKVVYFGPPEVRRRLYREKIVHQKFNVLLTTYEYLMNKNDRPKLSKIHWHYIIIDEGHRIKNASCKLNSDLKHYQSYHRLLLTGTPLQNNIDELWALLNFLLPNIFNSSEDFSQWFSKPFENSSDNSPDEALLSEEENLLIINRLHQVLRPFVLRRLKQKVANELPEKIERLIRCEASAYQKLLMKRVEDNLGSIGSSKGRSVHNSVMELRNICNHPYLSQLHTEEVHTLIPKHYLPPIVRLCGKLELLDRLLPKLKATDHRVLLFSTMTRLLDIMEEYLSWKGYRYLRLDGHTSGNERGALIEEFNKPDSPTFIFLLSIRAGGVGVNLQAADTVIIFDTDWNPQVDLQAQARAHRLGQKRDVLVLRLETVNTVEEQVRAAAEYKLGVANQSITAGFFDNNTSAEDRREYLESLLRECKKEEAALVLDDDALNDLIARSESEIDIFEALDKQRHEEEMASWKRLQERSKDGPLPSRLITDEDLSEFYKVLEAYEASKVMEKRKSDVGELDTKLYGRGKRAREVRSYEDQWTEEEFEKLCQADSPEPPTLKEVPKEVTVNPCASNVADGSKLENIEAATPPSKEPLPSSSEGPASSLKEPQPLFSEAPPPSLQVPLPFSSKEPLPSKEMPLPPIEALQPSKEISFPSRELLEPPKGPSLIASKDLVVLPCKVSVPQPSSELPLPLSKEQLPSPSGGSQPSSKEQLPLSSECPPLSSQEPRPINNEPTPPVKRGRGRPKRVQTDVSQPPRVLPMPSDAVNQLAIGPQREIVPRADIASVHDEPSGKTQHQLIEAPCSQAYSSPARSSTVRGQGRKAPGGSGKPRGRGKKHTSDSPVVACDAKPLSLLPNEITPAADNSPAFTSSQDTEKFLTRASNAPTTNFEVNSVSALQKPVDLTLSAQERQKSQACASDQREFKREVPVLEVKASDTIEIKSAQSEREQTLNPSADLGPGEHTKALTTLARKREQVFPTGDDKVPNFGVTSASTVHTSLVEPKKNDGTRTKSTKAGQKMSRSQSSTSAQGKQQSTLPDLVKGENGRIHPSSDGRSAAFETKPLSNTSFMESKTHDGSKLSCVQAGPERVANTQITTVASTLPVDLVGRENLLMVPFEMNPDIKLKETGKPSCVPMSQMAVASVPSHAVLPSTLIGTGTQKKVNMVKTVEVVVQKGNVHIETASNMSSEAMKNEALPVLVSKDPKLSSVDESKKRSSARAKQGSERKCSVSSSVQAVSDEKTPCVSKQAALTGLDYLLQLEPGNNDSTQKLPSTLEGQGTGAKPPITGSSKEDNLEVRHPVSVSVVKPTMSSEIPVRIGQESYAPDLAVESAPHEEAYEFKSVADAKVCSEIQVTYPQDVHSDQPLGVPPEGQPQLGSRDKPVSSENALSANSQQLEVKKGPLGNESLGRRKDRTAVAARQTPRRRTRASSEKIPSDTYPPIEKRVTRSAGRNARALSKENESEINEERRPLLREPDKMLKEALLVNTPLPTEVVSNNQFVVSGVNSKPIYISDGNSHELSQRIQESMKIESSMISTHSVPAVTQEHGAPVPEPGLKPPTARSSGKDPVGSLKDSSELADISLQEDDHAKEISLEKEDDIVASSGPGSAAISKIHLSSDQLKGALVDDSCGISTGEGTDSKQLSQEHTDIDCCMEVSHPPGFGPLEDVGVKASSVGVEIHTSGVSAAEEFGSPGKPCCALDVEVKEADPCFSAFTHKDPEKGSTDAAISVDVVVQEEDASCKKLAASDREKSASLNGCPVGVSKIPPVLTPVITEDATKSNAKFFLQGPLPGTAPINVINVSDFPTGGSVQDSRQADSILTDCSLAGTLVDDLVDNLPTSEAAPGNSMSIRDTEPVEEYSTLVIKSTKSVAENSDFSAQKHTERDATHAKPGNVSTISCSENVTSPQENAADLKEAVVIPKATECMSDGNDKTSLVNEVAGAGSNMACQNSNKVDDSRSEDPCVPDPSLMPVTSSQEIHCGKYVMTSASVDDAAIGVASVIPLQTDFSIEASHAECPKATSISVEQDRNSIRPSHVESLYCSISSELVPESHEMNSDTDVPPDAVVFGLNTEQERRGYNDTHISARCAPALASDPCTEQNVKGDDGACDCSKSLGEVVSVENILKENKMVDCAVSPSIATVACSSEQNTETDSGSLEAKCDDCGLLDASVSATGLPSIASEYSCSRDDPAHLVLDGVVDEENSMKGCNQKVCILRQEGKESSISHVVDRVTSLTTDTSNDTEHDDNSLSATCIGGKSKDSGPPEPNHPSLADVSCNPGPLLEDCQECPMLGEESEGTSAASFNRELELVETQTQSEIITTHSESQVGGTSYLSGMDEDVPIDSSGVVEEKDKSPSKTVLSLSSSVIEVEKADTFHGKIVNSDELPQIPVGSDGEEDAVTADQKEDEKVDTESENDPSTGNHGANPVDFLLPNSMENMASEGYQVTSLPAMLRKEDGKVDGISIEDSKLCEGPQEPTDVPEDTAKEKPTDLPMDVDEVKSQKDLLMDEPEDKTMQKGSADLCVSPSLREGDVSCISGNSAKVIILSDEQVDAPKVCAEEKEASTGIAFASSTSHYDGESEKDFMQMDILLVNDKGIETLEGHLDSCLCPSKEECKIDDRLEEGCKIVSEEKDLSGGSRDSSLFLALRPDDAKIGSPPIENSMRDKVDQRHANFGVATEERGPSEGILDSSLNPNMTQEDELANDTSVADSEGTSHTGAQVTAGGHTEPVLPPLKEEDHKVDDTSEETAEVFSKEVDACEREVSLSLVPCLKRDLDVDSSSKDGSVPSTSSETPMNIQLSGPQEKRASVGTENLSSMLMQKDDKVTGNTCEVDCVVGSEEKVTSINEKVEDANISNTSKDCGASIAPTDPINIQVSGSEEKEALIVTDDLSTALKGEHEMVNGEACRNSWLDMSGDDLKGIVQTGGGGKESSAGILEPCSSSSFNTGEQTANKTPEKDFKSCPTFDDPLGIRLARVETLAANVEPSSCHARETDFKVEGKSDKHFEVGHRDRESTGNAYLSSLLPSLKGADDKADLSGKNSKADNDSGIQMGALEVGAGEKKTNEIDGSSKMLCIETNGSGQLEICSAKAGTQTLSGAKDASCSHSPGKEKYNDPSGNDLIMRFNDLMDVSELEGQGKEASKGNVDLATSPTLTVECEKPEGFSGLESIQHIYSDDPTGTQLIESEIEEASTGNADSLASLMVEDEKNIGTSQKDSNHSMATMNLNGQMCTEQPGAEENEASTANADPYLPPSSSTKDEEVGSSFKIIPAVIINSDDPVDTLQEATVKNFSAPSLPFSAEVEVVCGPHTEDSNLIVESYESVGVLRDGSKEGDVLAENADFTVCTSSIAEGNKTDDSTEAPIVGAKEKMEVSAINSSFEVKKKLSGGKPTGNADQCSFSTVKEEDFKVCSSSVNDFNVDTSFGNGMNTLNTTVEDKASLGGLEDPHFPLTGKDEDLVVNGQPQEGSAVGLKSEDLMGVPPSGYKEIEALTASACPSFTLENEAAKVDALAMLVDPKMITDSDDPMVASQVASDENNNSSSSKEETPMIDAESEQSWMENEYPAGQMAMYQDVTNSDKVTVAASTGPLSSTKDEMDGCGKDPAAAANSSEPMVGSGASVQGNETPAQDATNDSGQ